MTYENLDYLPDDRSALVAEIARLLKRVEELEGIDISAVREQLANTRDIVSKAKSLTDARKIQGMSDVLEAIFSDISKAENILRND